jgi:hypothetical protein
MKNEHKAPWVYISPGEVARLLGVSENQVREWASQGILTPTYIIKVPEAPPGETEWLLWDKQDIEELAAQRLGADPWSPPDDG